MKKTIKNKITVWFAVVLVLISCFAMFALHSVSKDILTRDQTANIQIAVSEFSKKISYDDNGVVVSPGAHFYERGVYRILFDSNGKIINGSLPEKLTDMKIDFQEGVVREIDAFDNYYLEFDLSISLGGNDYWIKGIALLNDEMSFINSILLRGAWIILLIDVVAIIGAYIIVWRVFVPIKKIQNTAKEIAESNDLSRRIQIGTEKDEIHVLANTFDEMLDRIEQTLVRERQFSSDVSHELRTPISVIISECDYVLACAKTVEEYTDAFTAINRQAKRMQRMVMELLTISRLETHTIHTEFEDTDISELLSFVCDEQEEIQSRSIKMERNIALGIVGKADRGLLARLFINLIANAYQYSKANGTIQISLQKINDNIVFAVKDNGIGIADKELPLIWNRFYRGDKSRTVNESNSMGLGLSMVKWISDCHNGTVTVTSKINEGSEFVFSFPQSK